jgi:hypothetical protein
MIRPVHPVVATVLVQLAVLALALGHRTVFQCAAVGVAALLFLLAGDARDGAARLTRARVRLLTGAGLTTVVALLAALVPGDLGALAGLAPLALAAGYAVSVLSLPRRRNRGTAPGRR